LLPHIFCDSYPPASWWTDTEIEASLQNAQNAAARSLGTEGQSAGARHRRQEEECTELVDGDAIMHLELLEYMTDKFRTNHPTVSPDQQKLLALQVLAGVQQFIKDLKTMFKGKYPNAIRQDPQAVLAVAASKCTDVKGVAELLGTNYQKQRNEQRSRREITDRF
jgi:hypothetical protein